MFGDGSRKKVPLAEGNSQKRAAGISQLPSVTETGAGQAMWGRV